MALTLITPPAAHPITVEEVKSFARFDYEDEDYWCSASACRLKQKRIVKRAFSLFLAQVCRLAGLGLRGELIVRNASRPVSGQSAPVITRSSPTSLSYLRGPRSTA